MKQSLARLAAVALALSAATACDKATPVAPEGTILTISASPTKIGLTGSSTITVVGRKPNGQPLNPGTEIRFSVDKGTITPAVAGVNDSGIATATLRGDGRSGTAKVSATTGDGMSTATIDVQVGETTESKPVLIVSASPNTVAVGGTSTITVIGRNADGSPVAAGQQVILTTTLGSLSPSRPTTRADGTATSTLDAGNQAGTATITAILGASDPKTTDVTIRNANITLTANPSSVPTTGGAVELTALVLDIQGLPIKGVDVTFLSEAGTLAKKEAVPTDSTGVARNTLTLTATDLTNKSSVTVQASTAAGTASTIITVR
jgi:adhesin/invasin